MVVKKIKQKKNGKIGFCFLTNDVCSDLWEPYFELTKKYWDGFFGFFDGYVSTAPSKEVKFDDFVIKPLNIFESNYSFSQRMIIALNNLDCEFVFISLDDYWLKSKVDTQRLCECLDFMKQNNCDCIGFENFRKKVMKKHCELPYLCYLPSFVRFSCNLQMAIWRKNSLLKILRQNENPWYIEYFGSIRRNLFYKYKILTMKCGSIPILDYDFGQLVQRGKFSKELFSYFRAFEGIQYTLAEKRGFLDLDGFPKKSIFKKISLGFKGFLSFFVR